MGRKWDFVWEKLLSVLLTINIAMMGWLWTNIARLADRLEKHIDDRAIHRDIDSSQFVARREFDAWRDGEAAAAARLTDELVRLEQKMDKVNGGK